MRTWSCTDVSATDKGTGKTEKIVINDVNNNLKRE
jgi:hypothetical protein